MIGFAHIFQSAGYSAVSRPTISQWKIAVFLVLGSLLTPAHAQETGSNRYVMERTDQGLVRLDTQTGELSVCRERDGVIDCKLASDERRSVNARISQLEGRIAALETRLAAIEENSGNPLTSQPVKPKLNDLPSDDELDQVFNMMERFMHRFVDVFKDLDRKIEKDESSKSPVPEKT